MKLRSLNLKTLLPGAILILSSLTACQRDESTDDPEILSEILKSYFDGIKDKDFQKMKDATTNDFMLFEMGRVWNNDSVFTQMNSLSYSVEFEFSNFKINIDNSSGDMRYYNHGEFRFGDGTSQNFDWIESATFRKQEGKWKMNFLHITKRVE